MDLVVVSTAALVQQEDGYYAYGPYIKEMALWARHAGAISFVCPVLTSGDGMLLSKVDFPITKVYRAQEFDLLSARGVLRGILYAPYNLWMLFVAMWHARHIHLRCPGNISLLGCLVQMLFPSKKKTAKYAGNWDPHSAQPISYRWQKWLLSNPVLTRNMQVLVYGEWPGSTRNIKPFFTATYHRKDIVEMPPRAVDGPIRIVFAGTLSQNKNPLHVAKVVSLLRQRGIDASLRIFGEGVQRAVLEAFIRDERLSDAIILRGNQPASLVEEAYRDSHFLMLPSGSEGWPKVVAESMFWGCIPVASAVSCVPYMVDHGKRGLLLKGDVEKDADAIANLIGNPVEYREMSERAMQWSRQYTLDTFEEEIRKLLT